jgi:hypothetical protein
MASILKTNLQQNPSPPHSVTVQGAYEPFDLQIARNQIMGHDHIDLFGYSTAVGSTAFGPLWEGLTSAGGNYPFPSTAGTISVVSASASDTAVTMVIYGLDANFLPVTATVALNGTTPVVTTQVFLRINRVTTTAGNAVGNVTFTRGSTIIAQVNAGLGQTQMSVYTVPSGYTLYITYYQADGNTTTTSGAYMNTRLRTILNPSGVVLVSGQSTYLTNLNLPYGVPVQINEKTDFEFQFLGSGGAGARQNCYAGGYLIKNDGQTA